MEPEPPGPVRPSGPIDTLPTRLPAFLLCLPVLAGSCFPLYRGVHAEENLIEANARIHDLEKRTELLERSRGAQADWVVRMERMTQEINLLRGKVEELSRQKGPGGPDLHVQQSLELAEEKIRFLEERLKQFERSILAEGASSAAPDVRSEQEQYEEARRTYLNKRYDEALTRLEEFQKQFPKSTLMDNALFWQGMSHYGLEQWDKAILKFEDVRSRFPSADKAPDASYFEALAFQKLGDRKSARALLEDFKKKHPKSDKLNYVEKLLKEGL